MIKKKYKAKYKNKYKYLDEEDSSEEDEWKKNKFDAYKRVDHHFMKELSRREVDDLFKRLPRWIKRNYNPRLHADRIIEEVGHLISIDQTKSLGRSKT